MKRIFEKWCREVWKFEPGVYFLHPVQAQGVTIEFNRWLRGERIHGKPRFPHWYKANKFEVGKWMAKGIGRLKTAS